MYYLEPATEQSKSMQQYREPAKMAADRIREGTPHPFAINIFSNEYPIAQKMTIFTGLQKGWKKYTLASVV